MTHQFPDIEPQDPKFVQNDFTLRLEVDNLDWESGDVLTLPEGVKVYVLNENEPEGRRDFLVKFPPGYVEPAHTHDGAHASLLLQGRMLVHGRELTPGDYVYGQKVEHGPMEYPDGAVMFASFVGGSTAHEGWED